MSKKEFLVIVSLYLPCIRERKHDYENEEAEDATVAMVNSNSNNSSVFHS